ncbi:MAG: CRISPR-associated endonuclease Cas3'' [Verrucomicrobiales bacterium]|nr:CRISPR-associated endonuclease Cas3'' [Verrucomicrobiales bacterium]
MSEPLAHSSRHGAPTQSYHDHVTNVVSGALARSKRMLQHYAPAPSWIDSPSMLETIRTAATFHDLGKLDRGFQKTLETNRTSDEHIRHEDAGVAWLLANGADEAAGLVSAHHQGLVRYRLEVDDDRPVATGRFDGKGFRINEDRTAKATAESLESYLKGHEEHFGPRTVEPEQHQNKLTGLSRRLLLSCLVDADHSDTARHYGNEPEVLPPPPRWGERLAKLDEYVVKLPRANPKKAKPPELERQRIRDELYRLCRTADPVSRLRSCDAVVGSGKTTALMAHLLNVAATRNLRHIIVVLPYTNIIRQSVEVYRKALCLEGENPEEIVAEHHHQADFKSLDTRYLTTLWQAPIIVTTAVQFFETLASNNTSRLRKLHELPGSAVCLDEAHAELPASLWPICWNWLTQWTRRWNGHLVLASGSLPAFWTVEDFRSICEGKDSGKAPQRPAAMIEPLCSSITTYAEEAEHKRVKFITEPRPLSSDELIERVSKSAGPRLVVVNTVQSAAMLAAQIKKRREMQVVHLSTALTPVHRAIIIERVKALLKHQSDWVLVATSLVEAGMDFSFTSGFRQRASTASLIQLGGRVNRSANRGDNCTVLDFDFTDMKTFPDNPSLKPSKEALERLFADGRIGPNKPCNLADICLAAMKAEFRAGAQQTALDLVSAESERDYPKVSQECRVIQTETKTVVVDPPIIARLKRYERVPSLEIVRHSVQMFNARIANLGLSPVTNDSDLFYLPESWNYDPDFLGYMAEFINLAEAAIPDGFFI